MKHNNLSKSGDKQIFMDVQTFDGECFLDALLITWCLIDLGNIHGYMITSHLKNYLRI